MKTAIKVFDVRGRRIRKDGIDVEESFAKEIAEANGFKNIQAFVVVYTGQKIEVDPFTLLVRGFRPLDGGMKR